MTDTIQQYHEELIDAWNNDQGGDVSSVPVIRGGGRLGPRGNRIIIIPHDVVDVGAAVLEATAMLVTREHEGVAKDAAVGVMMQYELSLNNND